MRLDQFHHGLRASSGITGESSFTVIGTAAILSQNPELAEGDESVVTTHEIDIWPTSGVQEVGEVLESIGEMSPFHETFGFYIDPYQPGNAILPQGWLQRTIPYTTVEAAGTTAYCLEKHDLVVAKLARGDQKDIAFVAELIRRGVIDVAECRLRITAVDPHSLHYQHTGESPCMDIRTRISAHLKDAERTASEGKNISM
jgi:hypothetical protein